LVELGFITNYNDAMLMSTRPDLFAEGIYHGILEYTGLQ
ncbi:MAG: N-acetylmuramoyl-L-alanine amidase, partial [Clostridia bacterium]|nr:N-acetylmuramoyl-L-alanine amidase [Clostridia bacterium]